MRGAGRENALWKRGDAKGVKSSVRTKMNREGRERVGGHHGYRGGDGCQASIELEDRKGQSSATSLWVRYPSMTVMHRNGCKAV